MIGKAKTVLAGGRWKYALAFVAGVGARHYIDPAPAVETATGWLAPVLKLVGFIL